MTESAFKTPVPGRRHPVTGFPTTRTTLRRLGTGLCLAALVLVSACSKSVPDLLDKARELLARGDHKSATIVLKNALQQAPLDGEVHFLMAEAYVAAGEGLNAEKELRKAQEMGVPEERVTLRTTSILMTLQKYQQVVDQIHPVSGFSRETLGELVLARGNAFLGLTKLAEARTEFHLAMPDRPAEARLGLARIAAAEGNGKAAQDAVDEVIASAPKLADAWVLKGDLARANNQIDEAVDAYRRGQQADPASSSALLSEAVIHIGAGRYGEARPLIAKARKLGQLNPMLHFTNALLALREKQYPQCRDALQLVFSLVPEHMPSILLSGTLFYATGQLEQAQRAYITYLQKFPANIHARKMLAAVLLKKSQPESAAYLLEPIMRLAPKDAELRSLAAQAYVQAGNLTRARDYLEQAVALDPDNPNNRTNLGMTRIAAGDSQRGLAELESAVELNPEDTRADNALISALISEGLLDKALAAAKALEKRQPDKVMSQFLMGSVLLARKETAAARASLEKAIQQDPGHFPSAAALAQLDLNEGKPDAARGRIQAVLKHDPHNLDAMLALAKFHLEAKRRQEAEGVLRTAIAEHPQSIQALLLLVRVQMDGGNLKDALGTALSARSVSPQDPRVLELLAKVQLSSGDLESGTRTLDTLAAVKPRSMNAHMQLIEAYSAKGDWRAAAGAAKRALEVAPDNLEALSALGTVHVQTRHFDEALAVALRMQKVAPKRALGYALEGDVQMGQGNYAKAVAAYRKADAVEANGVVRVRIYEALERSGQESPSETPVLDWLRQKPNDLPVRFFLAELYNRTDRTRQAAEQYQLLLKQAPGDFRILNNLAWTLVKLGDPKALEYAQQAFQQRPNDTVVADTLGIAYMKQGRNYEGLQMLLKAVELDAKNADARLHLAEALIQAGDRERARTQLRTLVEMSDNPARAADARALLQKLDRP